LSEPLLKVSDLEVAFNTGDGELTAVSDVSLTVNVGETVALVGESGCGKTVTALSLLRLLPASGKITSGSILFEGREIREMNDARLRSVRGRQIAFIFQEPMTSLNPVFTVGSQIVEAIRAHESIDKRAATNRAIELLERVRIPEPARRIMQYPHQLSGGMQQRVMIAMALACNPAMLIADEPTTALDVTVQAEILQLIDDLKKEFNMSVLLITHDLGVVAETADRVYVMYAGHMAETAPVEMLFTQPMHPYTAGLLRAVPRLDSTSDKLEPIAGAVPNPLEWPTGCRFHPRCPLNDKICGSTKPSLRTVAQGHLSACHFAESVPWKMKIS